jgi:hypothetical protein
MGARLGIAVAAGLLLVGAVLAADTGGSTNTEVAWESGALFGGLLVVCAFLDRFREEGPEPFTEEPREQ